MAEHECRPEEGYAGIVAALGRAEPEDSVRLMPGAYEGAETLRLRNGVTLVGAGARLVHSGTGPAIEARGVASVTIEGLTIEVVANEVPLRREPVDAPIAKGKDARVEWGVIWFDNVAEGRIRNVSVERARAAHGICLRGGKGTRVSNCMIERGTGSGLMLLRTRAGPIQSNRCLGNALSGIVLASSHAAEIAENECWENQNGGILLIRGSESPDAPSEAALRATAATATPRSASSFSPPTPRRSRRTSAGRTRARVSCSSAPPTAPTRPRRPPCGATAATAMP